MSHLSDSDEDVLDTEHITKLRLINNESSFDGDTSIYTLLTRHSSSSDGTAAESSRSASLQDQETPERVDTKASGIFSSAMDSTQENGELYDPGKLGNPLGNWQINRAQSGSGMQDIHSEYYIPRMEDVSVVDGIGASSTYAFDELEQFRTLYDVKE
ncbi:unnamed protein product [Gongylonema pulchrum]|uniref:Cadherin_C domain-containing protein n=1 Tax=Gongylonema pulchrum TaxID=637853 RepID=A0A183DTT1_9BILA|nr:unnamed protein product [Gongylonema pulchrum]